MAVACFLVSLVWPSPDAETYRPGVILLIEGLAGLSFAALGFKTNEVAGAIYQISMIIFGVLLPNLLMFIFTYRVLRKKRMYKFTWIIYFFDLLFVCAAISFPLALRFYESSSGVTLLMINKLGGIILWTLSLALMAITLWRTSKHPAN